jgi:hypothetical protein
MNPLAFGKDHLHDLAADTRLDGHSVVRLNNTDTLQFNGHVPELRSRSDDGCGRCCSARERLRIGALSMGKEPHDGRQCGQGDSNPNGNQTASARGSMSVLRFDHQRGLWAARARGTALEG